MAAALTISVLFFVSTMMVRVAAVALMHTGVPMGIARFQAISALSGTGFTTIESEQIVKYPTRRRIISVLMIFGNLGVASVGATVIVTLVGNVGDAMAIFYQLAAMLIAGGLTLFIMTNDAVDKVICALITRVLHSASMVDEEQFARLLRLGPDHIVAEHRSGGVSGMVLDDLMAAHAGLQVIAIRHADQRGVTSPEGARRLMEGDELICIGSEAAHAALDRAMTGAPE